mgnify:CR=1 FL=1
MRKSETINELAAALSKAQATFTAVKKNQSGQIGTRTYHYADIHDVIEMVTPHLSKNGLSLAQDLSVDGDLFLLKTTVMHESGQWIESGGTPVYVDTTGPINSMQQLGKSLTYARRYDCSSFLNVASEEDTDGAGAPEKVTGKAKPKSKAAATSISMADGCTYGKNAGKLWADMDDKQLGWYAGIGSGAKDPADTEAAAAWEKRQEDLAGLNQQQQGAAFGADPFEDEIPF